MGECICNSCKNLKSSINDEGEVQEFECTFGFPSDICETCSGDEECHEECGNYIPDEEEIRTVRCKECGKELTQACSGDDDGEVYCISCYLNNEDKG